MTVSLDAAWGSDPNHVYAVGGAGTLLRYDGTSWRRIPLPTGERLSTVSGTSRSNVWVAGKRGTISGLQRLSARRAGERGIEQRDDRVVTLRRSERARVVVESIAPCGIRAGGEQHLHDRGPPE